MSHQGDGGWGPVSGRAPALSLQENPLALLLAGVLGQGPAQRMGMLHISVVATCPKLSTGHSGHQGAGGQEVPRRREAIPECALLQSRQASFLEVGTG